MSDTNTMLGMLAILLAVALGLLPYEVPQGKRLSRIFYSLCWISLAGTLLFFTADDSATMAVCGFALAFVGWAGILIFFHEKGAIYVSR